MVVASPYEGRRPQGRTIVLFVTLFHFLSCGKDPGNDLNNPGHGANEEDIDLKSEKSPIPEVPRRMLVKEVEWGNKKTVTAGVNTSFAGSTFAVETEVTFNHRFAMIVWLFAPGTEDALIDDGSIFLANRADRPYTFVCRYQGYMDIDPKLREKLTLFGNGIANENNRRETTGILQTSPTFPVALGASWPNIFKQCEDYAAKTKMMESISRDLSRMTKGLIYHDEKSACMTDSHCQEWHSTLLPGVQEETVPVCQKQTNGNRFCSIAGKKNAACSLYDKQSGSLLTRGMFEYKCATGLRCTATQNGGWLKNWEIYSTWKAECR